MFNRLKKFFVSFKKTKNTEARKKENSLEYSDFMKAIYCLKDSPLDLKTKDDFFIAISELRQLEDILLSQQRLR